MIETSEVVASIKADFEAGTINLEGFVSAMRAIGQSDAQIRRTMQEIWDDLINQDKRGKRHEAQ